MSGPRSRGALLGLVLAVLAMGGFTQWWHGRSEQRDSARLAALAQPGDIRMLSSVSCVYCEAARRWMTAQGVRFEECFIERDPACAAAYQATQARGTPTLLVRGQVQLGFDAARVLRAIESAPRPG
jgi:glutaredoxin